MRRTTKARGGSMREEPTRRLAPRLFHPSPRNRGCVETARSTRGSNSAALRQGQKPKATVQLALQASPSQPRPAPSGRLGLLA
jgi:hypothetical protein